MSRRDGTASRHEGKLERLPSLAAELVALRPAVIGAGSPHVIGAFRHVPALSQLRGSGRALDRAPGPFELIVNLKSAKALRLSAPAALLGRADRTVE